MKIVTRAARYSGAREIALLGAKQTV